MTHRWLGILRYGLGLGLMLTAVPMDTPAIAADPPLSVEALLKDGWEITGFASNFEGRSLILFKHKDKGYLAQCSVLYDVTRANRVVTNCYEVR